jgi:hypothetical protein
MIVVNKHHPFNGEIELMNDIASQILSNPILVAICTIAGLLFVFFVIRRFFKIVLILTLLGLIALFLYEGLTTPGGYKEKLKGAYDKTKIHGDEAIKKGREKIVSEGKELTKDFGRSLSPDERLSDDSKPAKK